MAKKGMMTQNEIEDDQFVFGGMNVLPSLDQLMGQPAEPPPEPKHRKYVDHKALKEAVQERARRLIEPTRLYEPLPMQYRFHTCAAPERIYIGSNRAGKTVCGAMELAWILRNCHPHLKYPNGGEIFIVGKDEKHIGDTLWPKLAKTQRNFRRIKDLVTGKWRAFRPWDAADVARVSESKPMAPLIPPWIIKGKVAWTKKARGVVSMFRTVTGWDVKFFTGGSNPPNGADIDYAWFDEEIPVMDWYTEIAARLLDRKGKFVWTATPQVGGEALFAIHQRAITEYGKPNPSVVEFNALLDDNPFIDQHEKKLLADKLKMDPEQYRVRILGQYLMDSSRVYANWSRDTHGVNAFPIPAHWCRYMVLDPGRTVCAALYFAVPPDNPKDDFDKEHAGHVYCYDETYMFEADVFKFAAEAKEKIGNDVFEAFLIDYCGSRKTDVGGQTQRDQFADALEAVGVKSQSTGSSFVYASEDKDAGILAVKTWLNTWAPDGNPTFLFFKDRITHLDNEMTMYRKKRVNGVWTDKPVDKNDHACDCLRYAAMHGLRYVTPRKSKKVLGVFERWLARNKKKRGSTIWLSSSPSEG